MSANSSASQCPLPILKYSIWSPDCHRVVSSFSLIKNTFLPACCNLYMFSTVTILLQGSSLLSCDIHKHFFYFYAVHKLKHLFQYSAVLKHFLVRFRLSFSSIKPWYRSHYRVRFSSSLWSSTFLQLQCTSVWCLH